MLCYATTKIIINLLVSNPNAILNITTTLYFITTFSFEVNIASCMTLRKQNTPSTATPIDAAIPATHTATEKERNPILTTYI